MQRAAPTEALLACGTPCALPAAAAALTLARPPGRALGGRKHQAGRGAGRERQLRGTLRVVSSCRGKRGLGEPDLEARLPVTQPRAPPRSLVS